MKIIINLFESLTINFNIYTFIVLITILFDRNAFII